MRLVTSNDFLIVSGDDGESRDVLLNTADTVWVAPGFDERYALGPGVRFFINVSSEGGLSQPVTLRVLIDGEQRFNGSSDLMDSDLEFLYSFR